MQYEKVIAVLKALGDRHPLDDEEKQAVLTAIGVLSWGSLTEKRLQARKVRRDQSTQW
jgi:hypothetical protein